MKKSTTTTTTTTTTKETVCEKCNIFNIDIPYALFHDSFIKEYDNDVYKIFELNDNNYEGISYSKKCEFIIILMSISKDIDNEEMLFHMLDNNGIDEMSEKMIETKKYFFTMHSFELAVEYNFYVNDLEYIIRNGKFSNDEFDKIESELKRLDMLKK